MPSSSIKNVVFTNVRNIWRRDNTTETGLSRRLLAISSKDSSVVVVENGEIGCIGSRTTCPTANLAGYDYVDLEGGSLAPGLLTFGSPLGLGEIIMESSTTDGYVFDALAGPSPPSIAGGSGSIIKASDGLQFATRNALCV